MGTEDEQPRLDLISAIGSQDSYLAVVSTLRSDGSRIPRWSTPRWWRTR